LKIEEVQKIWTEDSKINIDDIPLMDQDTVKGSALHSKYMNILSIHRMRAKKLDMVEITLKYQLEQFYLHNLYCDELGTLDKETGKNIPRKPSPKQAKTKAEAEAMIAADPKMVNLAMQIAENDEIVLFTKEVVEYIRWNRTKDISNHIEWLKWHNGQM
jgi:hypothetical protein